MRYVFIVNPKAGDRNRFDEVQKKAEVFFAKAGEEYKVYQTNARGHATEIANQECEKGDKVRIYGFGGDGTLLEIVRGAEGRPNAEVGIFPTGSGNDYIRTYGSAEEFLDFEKQIKGKSLSIDMIDTLGGSAVNICSVGFDAKVAYEMVNFKSLPGIKGSLAYDLSLAKCLMGKIGDKMTVKMKTVEGDKTFEGTYLFALAAGGRWYGGGYMGAPRAITNDGLLELILIKKPPFYKIPSLVGMYKKGQHLTSPKFNGLLTFYRGTELEITGASDIYCNRDGECEKVRTEKFSLSKGSLRFILPEGVEYGIKPILTERLIIRNWREDDFDDFMAIAGDKDVMAAAGNESIADRALGLEVFTKNILTNRHNFAIELKDEKKVIGSIGIQSDFRRWRINSKSIGYELNREYGGKGYMPEALKPLIAHAFDDLGLEVLSAYHFSDNEKSKSVIKQCGFHHEGTLHKGFRRFDGKVFDDECYSITREEYTQNNGR